jgi:hypothetical protein
MATVMPAASCDCRGRVMPSSFRLLVVGWIWFIARCELQFVHGRLFSYVVCVSVAALADTFPVRGFRIRNMGLQPQFFLGVHIFPPSVLVRQTDCSRSSPA